MVNVRLSTRQFLPPGPDFFAAQNLRRASTIQKIESDQPLKKNAAVARASQRLVQSFTIDPLGSPVDD